MRSFAEVGQKEMPPRPAMYVLKLVILVLQKRNHNNKEKRHITLENTTLGMSFSTAED